MKTGYLAVTAGVKGKMRMKFCASAMEARETVKGKGYVVPANLTYDGEMEGGGYDASLLRDAAGKNPARVYTIPWQRPEDGSCFEMDGTDITHRDYEDMRRLVAKEVATHQDVEFAWEDQGTLGMVLILNRGKQEWGWHFKEVLGIEVCSGGKNVKRMTQFASRKYLGYLVVDNPQASEFEVITDDSQEKVLDGAIVMPWEYKETFLEELEGKRVSKETKERMKGVHVYNGRLFVPGGVLEEAPLGCLVKGQVFFSRSVAKVTFHKCNIKKEVRVAEGQPMRVGLTPQEGKMKSNCNDDWAVNMMPLVTPSDRKERVTKTFRGYMERFASGKMAVDLVDLEEKVAGGRLSEGGRYVAVNRLIGYCLERGVPQKFIPKALWEEYLTGLGMKMIDTEKCKLRVKMEYTTHCQVVSHALMEIIKPGYLLENLMEEIPQGCMVYDQEYKVYIVNDKDYEDHVQVNHGGSDLDDFYDQIFRRDEEGKVWIFLLRNPNGWGEWSKWKFLGLYPVEHWRMKNIPSIPKNKAEWSTPRSLVKEKKESLMKKGTKADWSKRYGYEEFVEKLEGSIGGAGGLCNLHTFYNLHKRRGKDYEIVDDTSPDVTSEELIDACTQGDNMENFKVLKDYEEKMRTMLFLHVRDGHPIDKAFADGRKVLRGLDFKIQGMAVIKKTWFTHVYEHALEERAKYNEWVKEAVEALFRVPAEVLKYNGGPLLEKAKQFEKGWYAMMGTVEKAQTKGGSVTTDAGFSKLGEIRHAYVKRFVPNIREMVPYLAWHVWENPDRSQSDQRIMNDPLVLEAWCDWVLAWEEKKRLEGNEKRVMDHEYDCLHDCWNKTVKEVEVKVVKKKEKVVIPTGASVLIDWEPCLLEEDMEVEFIKWTKGKDAMVFKHESLGEVRLSVQEAHRVTENKPHMMAK